MSRDGEGFLSRPVNIHTHTQQLGHRVSEVTECVKVCVCVCVGRKLGRSEEKEEKA